jgi:hypothetical protein
MPVPLSYKGKPIQISLGIKKDPISKVAKAKMGLKR